jgi:hypothetical protein
MQISNYYRSHHPYLRTTALSISGLSISCGVCNQHTSDARRRKRADDARDQGTERNFGNASALSWRKLRENADLDAYGANVAKTANGVRYDKL